MSHFMYCHKKIAEHFSQLCSTETLLLHFWRVVLTSVNDFSQVIVPHDKTPPHPKDLGEVARQLLRCSQKQVESLPQLLTSTAACGEAGNTHQAAAAAESEGDNQFEACFMTQTSLIS